MTRLTILSAALTLFALSAGAQTQPAVQGSASASSSTTVNADKSGAQAASNSSASAQAGKDSANLASGTAMQAELTHPVDCKKNKPGDAVTAKTTEASTSDGQVVIPKGSKLFGHVTEARQHEKPKKGDEGHDSALGIAWDKAVLKNGQEVPLNASIQAIAAAQGQASSSINDADMPMHGGATAGGSGGGRGALGGVGGVGSGVGSTVGGAPGAATRPVGQVGSTASGAVNSTTSVAGSATGSATGTVSGAASGTVGGLNAAGQFVSNSHGVFGLNGLNLTSAASNSTEGSLITSPTQNVHLDTGTRMLLVAQGQAQGGAQQAQHSNPSGASRERR